MKRQATDQIISPWRYRRRRFANALLWVFAIGSTVLAIIPLGLLVYYVVAKGLPGLNLDLLTKLPKPIGESGGGMANAVVGSLVLIGLASALGLPVGILGGIYLAEFGNNRFGWCVRFAADVLSGVPSIVVGMFVYAIVVLPMGKFSALSGGIALGIMMIPIVMRTTEEVVRLVPVSLREAALALGATQSRTVLGIVLRAAKGGVITGALLATARVAGETAPLLMTAFGFEFMNLRLDQPIDALPLRIFKYAGTPFDEWIQLAWSAALLLLLMITLFSLAARYFTRGRARLAK